MIRHFVSTALIGASFFVLGACTQLGAPVAVLPAEDSFDQTALMESVRYLSTDELRGRHVADTEVMEKARAHLKDRMTAIGLEPLGTDGFETAFTEQRPSLDGTGEIVNGINLIGVIRGSIDNAPAIVVTAHYDHLGIRDGEIYNGADDNASGTAAALAIAESFMAHAPEHDIIIALLDAEEGGLMGAAAFVKAPPVAKEKIVMNINLDMVSKNDKNELYASGTYHYPQFVPVVEKVAAAAPVKLLMGHDRPEDGPDNWTLQSDHARFHQAGIPFVYFGVEDHPEYHRPTDDFDTIPQEFFVNSVKTIIMAGHAFDEMLAETRDGAE